MKSDPSLRFQNCFPISWYDYGGDNCSNQHIYIFKGSWDLRCTIRPKSVVIVSTNIFKGSRALKFVIRPKSVVIVITISTNIIIIF